MADLCWGVLLIFGLLALIFWGPEALGSFIRELRLLLKLGPDL